MIATNNILRVDAYFLKEGVIYFKDGALYFKQKEFYLDKNIRCSRIISFENSIFLSFSSGNLYEFKQDSFYKLAIKSNLSVIYDSQIIITYDDKIYDSTNWRAHNNLFSLKTQKFILEKSVFGNLFYFKGNILWNDLNEIKKITPDLKVVWQHNLDHLGLQPVRSDGRADTFFKFLGIKDEKVFVLSVASCIIVLNNNDGTLLKVIYNSAFPSMIDAFMHPTQHYIYCLAFCFVKINTQ